MTCAICHIRKPKRECPGVGGIICTTCCGTEREQSVDCPLSCEYLREAHLHEPEKEPVGVPNLDIELTESFLEQNEFLIILLTAPLMQVLADEPRITDYDMREAFEALVKSWRTLDSGLVYDQVPTNLFAAMICDAMRRELESLRRRAAEADSDATITDQQALGIFTFLQRLEYSYNNGRRRSRAFIDLITTPFRNAEQDDESGEEIELEPDRPRIIL